MGLNLVAGASRKMDPAPETPGASRKEPPAQASSRQSPNNTPQ